MSYRPCRLKFLVTSQPYDTIERSIVSFLNSSCLRLDGDDHSEAISEDINCVIDYKIPKLMSNLTPDNRRRISERLKIMNNRTYLWLRLTFYIIEQNPSDYSRSSDMDSLLDSLPEELSKAYEQILKQKNSKYARILFQLMLAAARPLEVEEAHYALTMAAADIRFESHSKVKEALWDADSFQSTAKNFCGLLIDFHDSKLSFIHQTVSEFLTDHSPESDAWNWRGSFKLPECHGTISRSCVHYLSLPESDIAAFYDLRSWLLNCKVTDSRRNYPFYLYAREYWPFHYGEQSHDMQNSLLEEARKLCRPAEGKPKKGIYCSFSSMYQEDEWTDSACAVAIGLAPVVRALIDEDVDIDANCGEHGTPLCIGVVSGFPVVVEMLLDAGANTSAVTMDGKNPIELAVSRNDTQMIKLLREKTGAPTRATEAAIVQGVDN